VPAGVVWLCGLHLVLLVAHSLVVPTWLGPDEPNHVDLAVGVREDRHYPAYDERHVDPGIRAALERFEFRRHARNLTAGEAPPRDARPTREALRDEGRSLDLGAMGRPGTGNHMAQHPPGYYALLAGLAEGVDVVTPGEGLGPVDREAGTLRWLSLLAAVPLPLVAWWVAREAGLAPGAATAAAVVPLAVPQLTHIAAVVNSDGLLVLVLGVLTGFVVRIARGATGMRTLAAAGLLSGAALLVKALAFVVPVWVLAAWAVGRRRATPPSDRPPTSPAAGSSAAGSSAAWSWLGPVAAYAACTLAVGGWWWIANLVRHGDISPSIEYATRLSDPPPGFRPDLGSWLRTWAPNMMQRYWGEFGWIDVALAGTLVVAATLWVAAGVVLAAGRALRDRRAGGSGPDLPVLGLLLAPTALLAVFVAANGYRLYREAGFAPLVQGRYLFGGLVGLATAVAAGWAALPAVVRGDGRRPAWAPRWTAVGFLVGALALQAVALGAMLDFWWGAPAASRGERLDALVAWSPWPSGLVWTVVALLPVVAGLTLVSLTRGRAGPAERCPAAASVPSVPCRCASSSSEVAPPATPPPPQPRASAPR
jgi:hypothetical protein